MLAQGGDGAVDGALQDQMDVETERLDSS
jgi:hypothetical protein